MLLLLKLLVVSCLLPWLPPQAVGCMRVCAICFRQRQLCWLALIHPALLLLRLSMVRIIYALLRVCC
jgi:hypothetical protein